MAASSNQNVNSFIHEAKIAGCGALIFVIGMAAATAGLYRTKGGGAINTAVVRYSLGGRIWAVLAGCILIIFLRNVLEKIFAIPAAIPAAAIEMRRDEEIQASQIGVAIPATATEMMRNEDVQAPEIEVAIPAAAGEMGRDEDVELEIQAPEIGVAISAAAIEMRRDEDEELEIQAP
ncbi:hypothetical protein Acr_08g0018160 [Actinidia rufa]|uniref:Uncharacterized protein n=1 Tax=Actinidia rufa TaxID=165716 RepID=A0A7J0F426_9ERIC|nr:hypothetical protein Acr_08g0018160 [Actinidia rufa]